MILTHDNADELGGVRGLGAELTLEEFGHEGGEDGEQESLRSLVESQAHERRVADEQSDVAEDRQKEALQSGFALILRL